MRKKYSSWYADWRDEHGQRKRKAFPTKNQAQAFQEKMQAQAARKKIRASAPSQTSARPGPRRTPQTKTSPPPAS
jgi:hypothetical protein